MHDVLCGSRASFCTSVRRAAERHVVASSVRVLDDGLALLFLFGRRVFLPETTTAVRLETVGAVAVIEGHRRLGYLLHDELFSVPDQGWRFGRTLNISGYRVV